MNIYHIHKSHIWQLRWWQEDPRRSRAALYGGIILMLLAAVILNNPPEENQPDQSVSANSISEPLLTETDNLSDNSTETASSTPGVTVIPRDQVGTDPNEGIDSATDDQQADTELSAEDTEAVAVAASTINWIYPAQGELIRDFGYGYDATYDDYRFHRGCDIRLEVGNIVQAAADGTILSATNDPLWGGIIVIDHGAGWMSVYKCLSPRVIAGDTISAGESIGGIIDSPPAEAAQVSHLHWEVYLNEEATSPMLLF